MKEVKKRGRKPQVSADQETPKLNKIDDKYFFDAQVQAGFTTTHYNDLIKLHSNGASDIKNRGINKVFEFGSGLGFFLHGAASVGLDVLGYDINPFERDFAISKGISEEKYVLGDGINLGLTENYDACYSVEVFEHIPDEALEVILNQISSHCQWLFMTSTPNKTDMDADWGHVNIKSRQEWVEYLSKFGYKLHEDWKTVTEWGLIFVR